MTTDTNATGTVTAEVKPEVKKVEVIKVSVPDAAAAIVAAFPGLEIRPTQSKDYRILGTVVDGDLNWKKGLIYQVYADASNIRLEMQLYSTKKGAHLVQFVPRFAKFNGAKVGDLVVEQAPKGLAILLRIKLPYTLGLEGIAAQAAAFLALVNPEVEAVRTEVTVETKAKKEKKEKKAKVVAEKTTEGTPAGKKVSKAKNKKPVAKASVEVPPLNPEIDAALAEIAK